MNTLIIYAHPNPQSFNHAILDVVHSSLEAAGHRVRVKDLYDQNFKPVLDAADLGQLMNGQTPPDIAAEQADVTWADALVFVHPIWWHDRPAILKGWFDRVMTLGFAYRYGAAGPEGLLAGKKGLVLATAGNPESVYDAWGTKDALRAISLNANLGFFGVTDAVHQVFYGVGLVDDAARQAMLDQAGHFARALGGAV